MLPDLVELLQAFLNFDFLALRVDVVALEEQLDWITDWLRLDDFLFFLSLD